MLIAIIEDNTKYRERLAGSICMFLDCTIIHKLNNALNIEKAFFANTPDIALVYINMPGLDGLMAVKQIT